MREGLLELVQSQLSVVEGIAEYSLEIVEREHVGKPIQFLGGYDTVFEEPGDQASEVLGRGPEFGGLRIESFDNRISLALIDGPVFDEVGKDIFENGAVIFDRSDIGFLR
jgi:hypothetical protein